MTIETPEEIAVRVLPCANFGCDIVHLATCPASLRPAVALAIRLERERDRTAELEAVKRAPLPIERIGEILAESDDDDG